MTVKELYDASFEELDQAYIEMDRQTQRACLGLQAFLLILIERGSIKWDDDSSVMDAIHHKVKTSNEAVRAKTNEMILDKMMDL